MELHHTASDEVLDDICEADPAPSHLERKGNWEQQQRAYDAFKSANDRVRDEICTRGAADPISLAQVERLNDELDRLGHAPETKALGHRRPAAGGGDTQREAIIAIGREVLDIGRKVSAMRSGGDLRGRHDTKRAAWAEYQRLTRDRREAKMRSIAEVKRDRPPGMASRYGGPAAYGGRGNVRAREIYRKAIDRWMRSGSVEFAGASLESIYRAAYGGRKDMHTELNPAGGYLVRPERHRGSPLEAAMAELTPMRRLATVRTLTEGDVLEIPQNLKGTAAGWVGERGARPETAAPELALTRLPLMELYAEPAVSQRLLDHVDFAAESWLVDQVAEAFSLQEGPAYINGGGEAALQPRGILTYAFVTDHSLWEHGKFRLVETGVDGAFPAPSLGPPPVVAGDTLIDVQSSLKTAFHPNASWLMNRLTTGVVRKLTDTQGRYLWQPGVTAGQPPTLLAAPIEEEPNMPAVGVNTIAIGYGDWARVYTIVEKGGVRMKRDDLTQKPLVLFYTTKLVGGGVTNFDAAVFLQFTDGVP